MPALLPIFLTASHIILAAVSVPKFDVEQTCRAAVIGADAPGHASADCQREEQDARSKLEKDWGQYSAAQRSQCDGLVTTGGAPSYVELLTCLEMAKQAKELPEDLPNGRIGCSAAVDRVEAHPAIPHLDLQPVAEPFGCPLRRAIFISSSGCTSRAWKSWTARTNCRSLNAVSEVSTTLSMSALAQSGHPSLRRTCPLSG